jgi:hypothetical protein
MNLIIQQNLILSTPNQITTPKCEKLSTGYNCSGLC